MDSREICSKVVILWNEGEREGYIETEEWKDFYNDGQIRRGFIWTLKLALSLCPSALVGVVGRETSDDHSIYSVMLNYWLEDLTELDKQRRPEWRKA